MMKVTHYWLNEEMTEREREREREREEKKKRERASIIVSIITHEMTPSMSRMLYEEI